MLEGKDEDCRGFGHGDKFIVVSKSMWVARKLKNRYSWWINFITAGAVVGSFLINIDIQG